MLRRRLPLLHLASLCSRSCTLRLQKGSSAHSAAQSTQIRSIAWSVGQQHVHQCTNHTPPPAHATVLDGRRAASQWCVCLCTLTHVLICLRNTQRANIAHTPVLFTLLFATRIDALAAEVQEVTKVLQRPPGMT